MDVSNDLTLKRFRNLESDRTPLNNVLEKVAENFYPERLGFQSTQTIGSSRRYQCFDSAPYLAMQDMASSIESMLMPKDSDWFDILPEGYDQARNEEESLFLHILKNKAYERIYSPQAGFLNMTSKAFPDIVSFGFAPMYAGRNYSRTGMMFKSFHPKNVYWTYGENGAQENTYVVTQQRVSEIINSKDLDIHPDMKKAYDEGVDKTIDILNAVEVNPTFDKSGRRDRMKYTSKTYDLTNKHLMKSGGYNRNPYIVPIWHRMDDNDLWSPGRFALPDVAVLNNMGKTILEAGHFKVRPPVLIPNDGITSVLKLIPGGVSSYNSAKFMDGTGRGIIEKVDMSGDLPFGLEMQEQRRAQIGEIFMRHILRLPEKYMSATEVMRYNDDLSRIVNSPFSRLETNLSEPFLGNVVHALVEESIEMGFGEGSPLPPMPETLANTQLKFKFRSPIVRAKEMALVARFSQSLEMMRPLIEMKPDLLTNVNLDEVFRRAITGAVGYDPTILIPIEEVQRKASEAQSAQEVATAANIADVGSRAAKNLSAAELNSSKAEESV